MLCLLKVSHVRNESVLSRLRSLDETLQLFFVSFWTSLQRATKCHGLVTFSHIPGLPFHISEAVTAPIVSVRTPPQPPPSLYVTEQ